MIRKEKNKMLHIPLGTINVKPFRSIPKAANGEPNAFEIFISDY
jgi:hypothetical protein